MTPSTEENIIISRCNQEEQFKYPFPYILQSFYLLLELLHKSLLTKNCVYGLWNLPQHFQGLVIKKERRGLLKISMHSNKSHWRKTFHSSRHCKLLPIKIWFVWFTLNNFPYLCHRVGFSAVTANLYDIFRQENRAKNRGKAAENQNWRFQKARIVTPQKMNLYIMR